MNPDHQGFHTIDWDREKSARFWNYYASVASHENTYFSKQFGRELVAWVQRRLPISGRVLDFGCGPGYLLEHLLSRRIPCQGLEFSVTAAAEARRRLQAQPGFQGIDVISALPTPFPGEMFSLIFLLETVEHLLPNELEATIKDIARLLHPGGHVFISVPNGEDLEAKTLACPECGCVFHRVQHVSSWDHASLKLLLARHGLVEAGSEELLLVPTSVFPGVILSKLFKWFHRLGPGRQLIEYLPFGTRGKLPHLLFLARKR